MKYEYVPIKLKGIFSSKLTEHREIIDQFAKKGYRYVGFIPTKTDCYGRFLVLDLVFEKDEQSAI